MAAEGKDAARELDWDLHIHLSEQGTHKVIRVTSNETIGTVTGKLMSKLGDGDWSDYVLWWPENKIWLTKPRQTLHGYGIMSDARLEFRPVHRRITVELPDKKRYNVRVNFAVMGLYAVREICDEFKIRHSEEISLMRSPMDVDGFDRLTGAHKLKRKGIFSVSYDDPSATGSPPDSPTVHRKVPPKILTANVKDERDVATEINTSVAIATFVGDAPDGGFFSDRFTRSAQERAYLNGLWIDSTRTLYEQGLKEHSLLYLRYKYYSFMDLDARLDEVRIRQLYEQAKWSILTETVDCTEEEAYAFAALQFQVEQAASTKLPELKTATVTMGDQISDIDQALNTLQVELGQKDASTDASPAIQLTGVIKFSRPTRLTLRTAKSYFFVLKGTTMSYYKNEDSYTHGEQPMQRFNLAGAKAVGDVDVSKHRYAMNVIMPSSDETDEIRLTFESAEEYCSWMAGCTMTTQGRPLAKAGYDLELESIQAHISIQNKDDAGAGGSAKSAEIKPENIVSPHILKKHKAKKIIRQVLEAHSSMLNLSAMEARLTYISNWRALADFGISYYIVRFNKMKKDELLGVSYDRLILMDMSTHERKKVWRYSAMRSWHVNWESKQMTIDHEDGKLIFTCLSADLRIIHEEVGCNIFLSLRKENGELPDEETFLRLTGGLQNNLSGFGQEIVGRRTL